MNLLCRAKFSGRIRLSSLSFTSSLHQSNSYSTSKSPKPSYPKSPKSPAPPPPPSSFSERIKKPTGDAIMWPKPIEIPYQARVANFVKLIGYVKAPVQFETFPGGKHYATTAISQEVSSTKDAKQKKFSGETNGGSKGAMSGFSEAKIERGSWESGESGVKKKDGGRGMDLWRDLVKNSLLWWDYRDQKEKGLVKEKYPDFKHKETGDALWFDSAPTWVLQGIGKLEFDVPVVRVKFVQGRGGEQGYGERKGNGRDEDSWKDLVDNPSKWWDNRTKEVVNALHLGQTSRASDLLSQLGSGDQALSLRSFIPILQFCASAPAPLFVMETWKLLMEKDVKLSGKCYFLTIKALCKGGYLDEAFSILNIQREHSEINPTLRVYNYLLKASVEMNSINHAYEVLHLMEQEGMLKDIITYSQLLKLAVLQQNLSAVHEIWKDCVNYYSLSIITLRKFIWAFTRLRDLESAYKVLQQMVAAASQHKFSTTTTYEERLSISRLDVPIPFSDDLARTRYIRSNYTSLPYSPMYNKENHLHKGVRFGMQVRGVTDADISLSEEPFSRPVMKLLMGSFDDIISSCAHSRNIMFAEQLMLQMRILGLEPSSRTYNGYIRALVSVKTFYDGMEVLNVMQQKNMRPSDSTLAALSVSCSRSLQLDLAETFLDQVSKCNHVNLFNEFLKACDTVDKPERAIRVWAKMKYKNLMPDIRTYELLFSLFGCVNGCYDDANIMSQADAAKRIKAIEMDMRRHSIQHNLFSLQNLLQALGREKMVKELIQYVRIAEEQCIYRSTILGIQIYNTFLHSLVEARECHTAIEIFKKMISGGLSPNMATYGIMIDCCSIINCYTSACAVISRIIRDGFPMNAVVYTCLVKILLKCEQFSEAFRLLDRSISEAIRPDLLMYNAILKIASQKGIIDMVEVIVEKMHRLKIQPDPSTCHHVFSAYAANGFHSTAMEALQVLSLRMISEDDNVLKEYRSKYENLILDEELDVESEIIGVFYDSPYLVVSLLNLRWYAILVSPPSWLPDQSPWARRVSSNYTDRFHG